MVKNYFVTTPIYYVNDRPHIGHAYTSVACDVLARFMRLDGYQVKFLTGTDEHGQKVEKSAIAAGLSAGEFTTKLSQNFRDLTGSLALSNDDFIRTTEPRHIKAAQALWQRLLERGEIYLGSYAGWYSVRDESFYAESELRADGKAPTGADVEWLEEPSYFFRLSNWQDRLLEFYESHPDFIAPRSGRNEILAWVKSGLTDLSVSRTSFTWGIAVPNDPAHVVYVWFDALINYITACGFPDEQSPDWQFWPADLHMVGKDIIRFHAVIWPAMLMAAGLPTPKRVFAHGWWTNEGQKISKSLGNVIDPLVEIESYGLDSFRYFLLREVSFGNDADYSKTQLEIRINTDLANGLGNLAQRVLSMIQKNCEGRVPVAGELQPVDQELLAAAAGLVEQLRPMMAEQAFQRALEQVWLVVTAANRYVDDMAPWSLRKTDLARMATVLFVLAEVLRYLGLVIQPFMPGAGARLLDQLTVANEGRDFSDESWNRVLESGRLLPAPVGLFPRVGGV
ncbi:MAG: methionine--tRNA ligase [Candidatus Pacebacteria bacterium]|nr:methionine--tRNA ligase [Candidatus Paceibacterota bacterium]